MESRDTSGTDLIPVDAALRPRDISAIDDWDSTRKAVRHSFDTSTDAGRIQYIYCLTGSDVFAQNSVAVEHTVTGWLLHAVDRVNEVDGSVEPGLRMVLLTAEGKRISTGSGPLIENWGHVVSMFAGYSPWPKLLVKLKAVPRKTGMGSYLQLDTIRLPESAKPTPKK